MSVAAAKTNFFPVWSSGKTRGCYPRSAGSIPAAGVALERMTARVLKHVMREPPDRPRLTRARALPVLAHLAPQDVGVGVRGGEPEVLPRALDPCRRSSART